MTYLSNIFKRNVIKSFGTSFLKCITRQLISSFLSTGFLLSIVVIRFHSLNTRIVYIHQRRRRRHCFTNFLHSVFFFSFGCQLPECTIMKNATLFHNTFTIVSMVYCMHCAYVMVYWQQMLLFLVFSSCSFFAVEREKTHCFNSFWRNCFSKKGQSKFGYFSFSTNEKYLIQ